jgi:hypothetical protein
VSCAQCGKPLDGRPDARYCSPACRQQAYRDRRRGVTQPPVTAPVTPPVTAPVTAPISVTPPVTAIDWDSLPPKAKEREAVMRRVIRKELEKEFRAEAAQYRAQCDANFATHKKKLDADFATRKAQLAFAAQQGRAERDQERRYYQAVIEAQRAKGLITLDDYNTIRSCLHPDSRMSATDEKLATAFRLFNDDPRIKILLVKEKSKPRPKRNEA